MKPALWTADGARLQLQSVRGDDGTRCQYNWLFLPGGPGLGAESLADLTAMLATKLSGAIWHLDLPGDGSNRLPGLTLAQGRRALNQAVAALERVVLVAHSSLGMLVQTMPTLEAALSGLVLIGSAPDASWQQQFGAYFQQHRTPEIAGAEQRYAEQPDDDSLRALLIASAANSFVTEQSLQSGRRLMQMLPVNHLASNHEGELFDSAHYRASWIAQQIPALIMNGTLDHITPFALFDANPAYHRGNIILQAIAGGGHYPWFENPDAVLAAFQLFSARLPT